MRGLIGYFDLESWWLDALSEDERELICSRWTCIGLPGTGKYWYEEAEVSSWPESNVALIGGIANMFQRGGQRQIAYKVLAKAEALITDCTPILDLHFFYLSKIETTYRDSNTDDGGQRCIAACLQQIAISPRAAAAFRAQFKGSLVEHGGYKRLAMIREHHGEFLECIRVCREALSVGWAGDWEGRAARCESREQKRRAKEASKGPR